MLNVILVVFFIDYCNNFGLYGVEHFFYNYIFFPTHFPPNDMMLQLFFVSSLFCFRSYEYALY